MSNGLLSPRRVRGSQSSTTIRSPLERKESLRAALDMTKTIQNVDVGSVKDLKSIVMEADCINLETTLEEKVVSHDEVLMDSEVMAASSKVLRRSARFLAKEISPYNTRDYAKKLLRYVHASLDETLEAPNWSILENEVSKVFKRTPNYTALCGCLEPLEPKVVAKRQPMKRDALAPIKRPDAIVEVAKDEENVDETVQKMKRMILRHEEETGGDHIEFWRFIINPNDFGKTVENMLHVSFLVRDGFLQAKLDENKNPVILHCTKETKSRAKKSGKQQTNTQNLFSLSPQQWQIMIKKLNITEPMINFSS